MVQLCYNTRKVVVAVDIAMARHGDMFRGVCMENSLQCISAYTPLAFLKFPPVNPCSVLKIQIIGELAPLSSVLGHQMHKCHKTVCCLIWMYVAACMISLIYSLFGTLICDSDLVVQLKSQPSVSHLIYCYLFYLTFFCYLQSIFRSSELTHSNKLVCLNVHLCYILLDLQTNWIFLIHMNCAKLILKMMMKYLVESQLYFLVLLANCHMWETASCIQTNHQHIIQLFMQKAIMCLSLLNSLSL